MSLGHGASIVRSGLALYIDAASPKSYPGSGTVITDLSGFGRSSSLTSGASFSSLDTKTFTFDGINDRITITDFSYPSSWDDPFSIETAIYIPAGSDWHDTTLGSNSGTAIVGRGSYPGSHGLLRADNQQFRFWTRTDSGSYFSTYSGALYDTWYILTGTYDGTNNSLYVNGDLIDSITVVKSGIPDSGPWLINGGISFGGNNGLYGAGNTPFVKIYNRALSGNEVKTNFEAHRGRFGI